VPLYPSGQLQEQVPASSTPPFLHSDIGHTINEDEDKVMRLQCVSIYHGSMTFIELPEYTTLHRFRIH